MTQSTANITDRIIEQAENPQQSRAEPVDRRARQRHPYHVMVPLVVIARGKATSPIVVRATELSAGGMSVISPVECASGSSGAVQLAKSNGTRALVGIAVRHVRRTDEGDYFLGLQFTTLPSELPVKDLTNAAGRRPESAVKSVNESVLNWGIGG